MIDAHPRPAALPATGVNRTGRRDAAHNPAPSLSDSLRMAVRWVSENRSELIGASIVLSPVIAGITVGVLYKDAYLGFLTTLLIYTGAGAAVTALQLAACILLCIYGTVTGTVGLIRDAIHPPQNRNPQNNRRRDLIARRPTTAAENNLRHIFNSQQPTIAEAKAIRDCIAENLALLQTTEGMVLGKNSFSLTNGRDYVSWKEFKPTKSQEWCLFKRGESKNRAMYDLILVESLQGFIRHRNPHPYFGRPLKSDDFVRGKAVLAMLTSASDTQPQ